MLTRDSYSDFVYKQAISPIIYNNIKEKNTIEGLDIDMSGYKSLIFLVEVSNIHNKSFKIKVKHTDNISNYVEVPETDVIIQNIDLENQKYQIGYKGNKRYVKLVIEFYDTIDNCSVYIGAVSILGK